MLILTESRGLRSLAFTALYLVQGFGVGPLLYALPAYFAQQGLSPAAIGGFVGIIFLPWSLKLVAGPMMDRWSFLPMGRRRPWVLAAQAGAFLSFVAAAFVPQPLDNIAWLVAACFAANSFLAFQDVAIDGMAVDVLPVEEQANANALMFGSQALGIAGSTAASAWMFSTVGLGATFLTLAAVFALSMLPPLLLRERAGERLLPWSSGDTSPIAAARQLHGWRHIGQTLWRVGVLPASVLLIGAMYAYRTGYGVITAAMPVLSVQQLGWTDTAFSQTKAGAELVAAVVGMTLGGWLARRIGTLRLLKIGSVLLIGLMMAMAWSETLWSARATVTTFVVVYGVSSTLFSILTGAVAMSICWTRVAATQFGLYMAIANMGLSSGSALFGLVSRWLSYPHVFLLVGVLYLVTLVLLQFVDDRLHIARVDALERSMASARPDRAVPLST